MPDDGQPDFFSSNAANNAYAHVEETSSFARAIESRFDSSSVSLFSPALLSPPKPRSLNIPAPPAAPMASMSLSSPPPRTQPSSSPSSSFSPVLPDNLDSFINDPSCLILDIRSNAAFSSARLPRAVSLSVPSTLLKRPLFSLEKLSQMLPSKSARARFTEWSKAATILVYDADTSTISDSSNINGLLRKFRNEGFSADKQLAWLKGGFVSVWRERSDLVVSGLDQLDDEDEEDADTLGQMSLHKNPSPFVLRTKDLAMSAFTLSSTTSQPHRPPHKSPVPAGLTLPPSGLPPRPVPTLLAAPELVTSAGSSMSGSKTPKPLTMAANPFYDNIRQNMELSQGISEKIPLTLPTVVRERIDELPFPWLRHIARRAGPAPKEYMPKLRTRVSDSSTSSMSSEEVSHSDSDALQNVHPSKGEKLIDEGAEALAMQFYRIELGEQRRLMGIMQHHSQESGNVIHSSSSDDNDEKKAADKARVKAAKASRDALFPYSITAGVEKGAKNRYRNIWPFEHARVKLHRHTLKDDDYINASFVQPLGTRRRYIATQGPLDATLTDFWTLVWEQNVHVIVMLTKEVEGMQIKSAKYWDSAQHGPLTLTLIGSNESKEQEAQRVGAEGWWGTAKPDPSTPSLVLIKRKLELRHKGFPKAGVRSITQLQYLDWPDLNVPEDPRGILSLVQDVDSEVDRSLQNGAVVSKSSYEMLDDEKLHHGTGIMKKALENPPVLLHCSAGVGRTGGFIAVDAVLDGVRREVRKKRDIRKRRRVSSQEQDKDITMAEGDLSSTLVEDNSPRVQSPAPGSGLVMPIHGGGASDMLVHVPVVGWSHGKQGESSASEDISPNPDHDNTSPMDVDTQSQLGRNRNLMQTSPWMSTRGNLKEWIGGTSTLEEVTRPSVTRSYSSEDSATGSHSSSNSGSKQRSNGSNGSSEVDMPAHTGMNTASSTNRGTFQFSSSPSTSSSSVALNEYGQAASTKAPSSVPSPPKSSIVGSSSSSSSSSTRFHSGPKNSSRTHSRFGSSAQDSTSSSSIFDSAQALESSGPSSATSATDLRSKPSSKDDAKSKSSSSLKSSVVLEASSARRDNEMPYPEHQTDNPSSRSSRHLTLDTHEQAFDYTAPRLLNNDESPLLLSTYDEPVRRIVEDMREQRMSLCQSLRQYVFVHRAIIEGSLMIIDEEKERNRQERLATAPPKDAVRLPASRVTADISGHLSESGTTTTRGKRNASPTELIKENKSGERVLSKRPSTKRKHRSEDDLKQVNATLATSESMPLWSPFPPYPSSSK